MANQSRKNTPQEAVKQAMIAANGNRMPEQKSQKSSNESTLILGDNLTKEWNNIVKAKKSTQVKDPLIERLNQHTGTAPSVITRDPITGMGRASGRSGMARTASVSVDRVYDVPFSPFRNRFAVEQPMNRIEMLQRFRYYFRYEPLVRASMELHTEFPLSTFELKHSDPVLKTEFMDMCEDINLFEFLLDMVLEYWLIGGCAIFGIFDDPKQPCVWKKFVLLNPLYVDIENSPFTDGRSEEQMKLRFDERTRGIVANGPRDPNTGKLYNRLPADIIESIRNGDGTMPLNNIQASYFKRKGNYFSPYGESLLFCVSHLLAYRDKLRDSLYFTCDRHCLPEDTEVLTETGFKPIKDVSINDNVMTFNKDRNLLEYQKPSETQKYSFNGNLVHFKNRRYDFACTDEHRMLVQTTTHNWKVKLAKDVKHTNRVKVAANWTGTLPEKDYVEIAGNKIDLKTFLKFAGYFVSEGYSLFNEKTRDYRVSVGQANKSDCLNDIQDTYNALGIKYSEYQKDNGKLKWKEFTIYSKQFAQEIADMFGATCYEKHLPDWIKQLPPEHLKIILQTLCNGDAHEDIREHGWKYYCYTTCSEQLANDIQEIAFKCGYYTGNREDACLTNIDQKPMYKIFFSDVSFVDKGLWLKFSDEPKDGNWKTELPYEGNVYCLTVPNTFFVTRYNGRISIHGNSTPREVWKLGTDALPASEEEIGAFQSLLSQTYLDPNQAIIWNHALQHELIGAADKMLPVSQEITKVEEEMLIGLMLNKGFLDSAYGAYANMSVALDVLISRYLTMRTRIERWMKDNVFAPICRIHNIYKPTQAELSHRIRIKHSNKRPWVPEIAWSKNELRDTNQKIQLLMQFREKLGKPGFPRDRLYEMVGENPEVIKSLCRKEQAELKNESPMGAAPVQMGGPGLDLGGGGGPALGTDLGIDMNTGLGGEGGGPEVGAPAGGAGGPMSVDVNQSIAPPESANAGVGNTGNIGG